MNPSNKPDSGAVQPEQATRQETPTRCATLKQLRKESGLIQKDLAKLAGTSTSRICDIEKLGYAQSIESIRSHVEALGGELKLIAKFENRPSVEILDPAVERVLRQQERKQKAENER